MEKAIAIAEPKTFEPKAFELSLDGKKAYVLRYKTLMPQSCNFLFDGDKEAAIAYGQGICQRMRWKFIHVDPLFEDLEALVERKMRNEGF